MLLGAAIPMTSFGMLMNPPHSEFQRISPQKRASIQDSVSSLADFRVLDYFRIADHPTVAGIFR
jgi:hypothetical protein